MRTSTLNSQRSILISKRVRTIKLLIFFFLLPVWVSAQLMEERTPFSEYDGFGSYTEQNFQWQSDFIYSDMYAFYDNSLSMLSGDFLTNIFSNSLQNLDPDSDDHRDHLAISSIPLGNGVLFLIIISILYLSILLIKRQKLQMKKIKISVFVLFFLFICSGNSYAQIPFAANPDNFFVQPNSSANILDVLRNDESGACNATSKIGRAHV